MKNVFIAVPTISNKAEGQVHPRLASVLNQAVRDGAWVEYVDEYRPIPAAREEILKRFGQYRAVKPKTDWLVMIDLDTVPSVPVLQKMVATPARRIVAAAYAMASTDGRFQLSLGRWDDEDAGRVRYSSRLEPGWTQYDVCGFGCIAFHTSVLDRVQRAVGKVFRHDPPRTEDVCFFRDYAGLGPEFYPWANPELIAEHWRISDITRALTTQEKLLNDAQEGLAVAIAHGFKAHEKGQNLEWALDKAFGKL